MHVLLEVLAGLAGGAALVLSFTVGLVLRRFRRANRLIPERRTPVPLTWRWSPRRPAQLHRRLQRACALVLAASDVPAGQAHRRRRRRRPPPPSVLATAAGELVQRALEIDAGLADADRRGAAWRRVHLPGLASEVRSLEAAAVRLRRLRTELDATTAPLGGRPRTEELLDAYEAALQDLRGPAARLDPGHRPSVHAVPPSVPGPFQRSD